MEKIININLAGRVIAIEDGAYTTLKAYVESLHGYFGREESGDEIINDIESRIAELMAEKLAAGTPAITEAQVAAIVASMGRVEDFAEEEGNAPGAEESTLPRPAQKARRFARDRNDKIAGGVCAGLASYLNVDPALVRIVFALLTIGGFGTGVPLYIILWIFVPAADITPYRGRRLYRNGDDKWLGGVASGLAAFFRKEAWAVRLIWAAPLLLGALTGSMHWMFHSAFLAGGIGSTFVLIYIVLWVVLPVAVTDFQKMEMRGEKIDIASIRDNVYADIKDRATAFGAEVSESASRFVSGRGRRFAAEARAAARPVASRGGEIIGTLFKAFIIFLASVIAFALFIGLLAYFFGGGSQLVNDFILDSSRQRTLAWIGVLLLLGVPMLAMLTTIVRRILRIQKKSGYFALAYSVLWTAGIVCVVAVVADVSDEFRYRETVQREIPIVQPAGGKLTLTVAGNPIEDNNESRWRGTRFNGLVINADELRSAQIAVLAVPSPDSLYHVIVKRRSYGGTPAAAKARAERLSYHVQPALHSDSVVQLSPGFAMTKGDRYRGQAVTVEVQVPRGKQVRFDESVDDKLNTAPQSSSRTVSYRHGRRKVHIKESWPQWHESGIDYVMSDDGTLRDPAAPEARDVEETYQRPDNNERRREAIADSLERAIERLQERREALDETEDEE